MRGRQLKDAWNWDDQNRRSVLEALLWIGTSESIDMVIELLKPHDSSAVTLLVSAIEQGSMKWAGIQPRFPIDGRLVAIIDSAYDELAPDVQRGVLWQFENGRTPAGIRLIERVTSDPRYDLVSFGEAAPAAVQTLRSCAFEAAVRAGSPVAVDYTLDKLSEPRPLGYVAHCLGPMNQTAVVSALRKRLARCESQQRVPVLQLIGWFGNAANLPDVRPFIKHEDHATADAAYEAEQLLLGTA